MKTVIGLFDNFAQARDAVHALESAGISVNDISIVANKPPDVQSSIAFAPPAEETTGQTIRHDAVLGAEVGGVAGLIIALAGLAVPGFGWAVGAGWLWAIIAGVGIGAISGGLVGGLTSVGVPKEEASYYEEGVR
jgi:hypothetical protein